MMRLTLNIAAAAGLLLGLLINLSCRSGDASDAGGLDRQWSMYEHILAGDYYRAYDSRRDSVINFYAEHEGRGFFQAAMRLRTDRNIDSAVSLLDSLARHPRGDMFWMFPVVMTMYEGRDRMPDELMQRLRDNWRTYMPNRGDTENHWAMYYTALYLVSQMYPDDPADTWYTGKNARENFEEAEEYLLHWMDLTTTIGQGEYDSPAYLMYFLIPMAQLYGYAEDPAMRLRAQMMLDYLIADFAVDALNGLYTGAHSRVYPWEAVEPARSPSNSMAWLLFGEPFTMPSGGGAILALSGYQPPLILHHIATDRSQPYIHREYKRTRHRMRHSDVRNAPVYRYTYMTDAFSVGSSQGGLLQPIQQQTWSVTWAVDDPRDVRNTLFTIHPYSSPIEGAMYFSELPEIVTELIVRSKTTYDSWDKWTGGSPYEQVVQHEEAVIALYDIPEGTRFPHIGGYFSKDLAVRDEDESGWIFARGGHALIAYYPLAPYEWMEEEDNWRLHSTSLKNGAVVQVADAREYDSFDAFKQAVRALSIETAIDPVPEVQYTTLRGAEMHARYGDTPTVNGNAVDYENWPLYDGPFLQAERHSRELTMSYGPMRRHLDFNTLTVRDWIEQD